MKTAIIFGAGLTGCTVARCLAESGFEVEILEKKDHLGGSVFDYDENGILIHKYGPHIFHTSSDEVFFFLSHYTEWDSYKHIVLGNINDKLSPIPFNLYSVDQQFSINKAEEIKRNLLEMCRVGESVSVHELLASSNPRLHELGVFVAENVFKNYTLKQWGMSVEELDRRIFERVPVRASYECGYFSNTYECMPRDGFSCLIQRMLEHPRIKVELNIDGDKNLQFGSKFLRFNGVDASQTAFVYTGSIDRLMRYRYGILPYRSIRFQLEKSLWPHQPVAVVNYPNNYDYTRITEFAHFYPGKRVCASPIMYEFPLQYTPDCGYDPLYPMPFEEARSMYRQYQNDVARYHNFYMAGRLGIYKYMDMDTAVLNGMDTAKRIIEDFK